MSPVTSALSQFHLARARAIDALRPHARPLVLACMLAGSLLVWTAPAASESRCMLVKQVAFTAQATLALSMVLTTLAWYFHKPILRHASALPKRVSRRP